jgi:hypothetical protein
LGSSIHNDGTLLKNDTTFNLTFTEQQALNIHPNLQNGTFNVGVHINDNATNLNIAEVGPFKVDPIAPEISLDTVSEGQYFNTVTPAIWFNGTYSDNLVGINASTFAYTLYNSSSSAMVSEDFVTGVPTDALYNYSAVFNVEAVYNISFFINDYVDNTGVTSANFTVDWTAPVIALNTISEGMNVSPANVVFNGTYWDNVAGVDNSTLDIRIYNTTSDALVGSATGINTTSNFNYTYSELLSDGDYNVTIEVDDKAGNSASFVTNFTVDSVAPVITLDSITEGMNISSSNLVVNGTYSDDSGVDNSTLRIYIFNSTGLVGQASGTSTPDQFNYTYSGLDDGLYNVSIYVSDIPGNVNTTSVNFTVDTTAPLITLDTLADFRETGDDDISYSLNSFTTNGSIWFNGTYSDDLVGVNNSTFYIYFNNLSSNYLPVAVGADTVSYYNYSAPFDGEQEGKYQVNIGVHDFAGNSNMTWAKFIVDWTDPQITLDTIIDGTNLTSWADVSFNGTLSDNVGLNESSLSIVVDGEDEIDPSWFEFTSDGSSYNYTINATSAGTLDDEYEGTFNVTVSVSDLAGNTATTTLVSFTVDATDPSLTLDTISEGVNLTDNLVWFNGTYSDEEGTGVNLSSLVLMVNGTVVDEIEPGASSYNHSITLGDGAHNVYVAVSDYAGNTNETVTVNFRVDTVDPVVTLDTISEGVNLTESLVWFNGTYSDAGAGINTSSLAILVNGADAELTGTANENSYNHSITLSDGDYNVSVSVSDYAGLTDTTELVNFTVDATDPSLTLDTISEGRCWYGH